MPEKKKVNPTTECKGGKHTFVVTRWRVHGGDQQALMMRCQHCLMAMDMEELKWLQQGAQDES